MKHLGNTLLYAFIAITVIGECLVGSFALGASGSTILFCFLAHTLLAGLYGYLAGKIKNRDGEVDFNFSQTSWVLVFALPVYGMIGMSLIHLCMSFIKMEPVSYFEFDEDIQPDTTKLIRPGSRKSAFHIKKEELDIDAYVDLFRSNDRQLEENAVNRLSRMATRESAAVLKEVVVTAISDTRILAATALIEMEDKITEKIERLREKGAEDPEDLGVVLELARVYDLYCYLDVLDQSIKTHYQGLALQEYQKFLEDSPTHRAALMEYGRVLINAGEIDKAIEVLQRVIEIAPDDASPRIWLAEAYYEQANYANVIRVCQGLRRLDNVSEKIRPILECWS